MKKVLALIVFQVWTAGLMIMFLGAIVYTIFSLCTGNYTGTACREF
jgi:hypothetical protein